MTLRAVIRSTGAHLPEKVLTNQDLEKMVDTTDEWIVERTGIRARHLAEEGVVSSDLAVEACRRALEAAGRRPEPPPPPPEPCLAAREFPE